MCHLQLMGSSVFVGGLSQVVSGMAYGLFNAGL